MDWFRPTIAIALVAGCSIDLPPLEPVGGSGGAGAGGSSGADSGFPVIDAADAPAESSSSDVTSEADAVFIPAACAAMLNANPGTPNGVYKVTLPSGTTDVYCDMGGGGWTLAFLSNRSAVGKVSLKAFYSDVGAGNLKPTEDENDMYALKSFASVFHYAGIELRLTWACGTDHVLQKLLANDFSQLDSGQAVWRDNRVSVLGDAGGLNPKVSFFNWSGSSCWNAAVATNTGYGFALGSTDSTSFIGWYTDKSTAITPNLNKDGLPGTVAGWFR